MLALTRKVGEEIVIGDPAKPLGIIRVVDIHGDKVRLSFDFPRETQINRRELADQKAKHGNNGAPKPPGNPPAGPNGNSNGNPPDPNAPPSANPPTPPNNNT